jgi:hypothetical protein
MIFSTETKFLHQKRQRARRQLAETPLRLPGDRRHKERQVTVENRYNF